MNRLNELLFAFDNGILDESLLSMCLSEHEQIQTERIRLRNDSLKAREDDNCPALLHDEEWVDSGPRTIREYPLFV